MILTLWLNYLFAMFTDIGREALRSFILGMSVIVLTFRFKVLYRQPPGASDKISESLSYVVSVLAA